MAKFGVAYHWFTKSSAYSCLAYACQQLTPDLIIRTHMIIQYTYPLYICTCFVPAFDDVVVHIPMGWC